MKTCPDCGCRVYKYGCVNCNEVAYINAQATDDSGLPTTRELAEDAAPFADLPESPKRDAALHRWRKAP